jgi:DsbC/DsbD-like thiol-disulfide interchange protein
MFLSVSWLLMMALSFGGSSVYENGHIQWHFSSIEQSGSEWKLLFTAAVDRGWHIYSQSTAEGGPMPTAIVFDRNASYKLIGKTLERGDVKKSYDSTFMMDVAWYEGDVVFSQRVKVKSRTKVTGEVSYSVCSEQTCIPGEVKFTIDVGH